jgi:hypothetical protein
MRDFIEDWGPIALGATLTVGMIILFWNMLSPVADARLERRHRAEAACQDVQGRDYEGCVRSKIHTEIRNLK